MSEVGQIVLTAFATLVFGQLVIKFFIDPFHEQAKVIGKVAYALAYYAPIYANPAGMTRAVIGPRGDLVQEAEDALRHQASRLIATTTAIRWYGPAYLVFAPSRKTVLKAAISLIGLSNLVRTGRSEENMEIRDDILKWLGIRWKFEQPRAHGERPEVTKG